MIVRELKELQSLSDALAVCNPLPQSLLQLIKDKAQRVVTLTEQVMTHSGEISADFSTLEAVEKPINDAAPVNNEDKGIVLNTVSEEFIQPEEVSVSMPVVPPVSVEEVSEKSVSTLAQKLTLNERFRFLRNLFSGNESLMMSVFAELDNKSGLDEMEEYLKVKFQWDWESAPVLDFVQFLERNIK
ncbi:hypothetical protein [Parabacteroides sp. FAFU027]|uniref:hypothetical protein n=1 Tax=Parabacteroides sp. FAFU027 TaxID=2922715 RepID=UPI001FAF13B4|nr:hypothetical protein [Parabacteroides sp. FAFU027]